MTVRKNKHAGGERKQRRPGAGRPEGTIRTTPRAPLQASRDKVEQLAAYAERAGLTMRAAADKAITILIAKGQA